jgi:hypothetical protein
VLVPKILAFLRTYDRAQSLPSGGAGVVAAREDRRRHPLPPADGA